MSNESLIKPLVQDANIFLNICPRKGDGSYMSRVVCEWKERVGTNLDQIHHHIYAAGIDENKNVYLDCRKRLIFFKILISTVVRPLHCVVKTLYHLTMIPVVKAVFSALKGEISFKKARDRSFKSIADIARTPIYETAMIVVGLTGLIIAPFAPKTLYRFREYIAKIESALFRNQYHSFILAPCFQGTKLRELVEDFGISQSKTSAFLINFKDTDYGQYSIERLIQENVIVESVSQGETFYKIKTAKKLNKSQRTLIKEAVANRAMIHYGRSMIKARRKHYNPFYQIFGKLNPNKTYVSMSYGKTEQIVKQDIGKKVQWRSEVEDIQIGSNKKTVIKEKPINFNLKSNRLRPGSLKIKPNPLKIKFKQAIKKDLEKNLKNLENKAEIRRIHYLISSVVHAFEDAHSLALTKNPAIAMKSFKNQINKLLDGIEDTHKIDKDLKRDGYALLPCEIAIRDQLKASALKRARSYLKKVVA